MSALATIAIAGLATAIYCASLGNWMPLEVAAVLLAVYAAAFAGDWCMRRRRS